MMNHGTPSLSTAGTGDVLSGILGALTAQGLFIDDASIFATYLHGECAHQYNELVSYDGLTATDLSSMIPYALETIQNVY
jgi:NAD(P)H-hydrate repair Nnr-like enzyme with NAD(P)H-hydrate dehydratase domain